jgi:hypothetical protein
MVSLTLNSVREKKKAKDAELSLREQSGGLEMSSGKILVVNSARHAPNGHWVM